MAISHQRRQGAGTVDGQALTAAQLAAKSDLYRMAIEFAPGTALIPITRSWEIGINENPENDLSLGGLYFGKWIVNHNSQDVGDNDNSRKRSEAFLMYGNYVAARTMIIVHGDDILSWKTATTEHYGFATSLHVRKLEEDDQPQHGVQVSFIGYKISENAGFTFPAPSVQNGNTANVGLSASDLQGLGYTYQWNVITGGGTFTNPNSPNTVYVQNSLGNYELSLVVTSPNGAVSDPVSVVGNVTYSKVQRIKNVGTENVRIRQLDGSTFMLTPGSSYERSFNSPEDAPAYGAVDILHKLYTVQFDVHGVKTGSRLAEYFWDGTEAYYQEVSNQVIPDYGGRVINNSTSAINYKVQGWSFVLSVGETLNIHDTRAGLITSVTPFHVALTEPYNQVDGDSIDVAGIQTWGDEFAKGAKIFTITDL